MQDASEPLACPVRTEQKRTLDHEPLSLPQGLNAIDKKTRGSLVHKILVLIDLLTSRTQVEQSEPYPKSDIKKPVLTVCKLWYPCDIYPSSLVLNQTLMGSGEVDLCLSGTSPSS